MNLSELTTRKHDSTVKPDKLRSLVGGYHNFKPNWWNSCSCHHFFGLYTHVALGKYLRVWRLLERQLSFHGNPKGNWECPFNGDYGKLMNSPKEINRIANLRVICRVHYFNWFTNRSGGYTPPRTKRATKGDCLLEGASKRAAVPLIFGYERLSRATHNISW